MLLYDSLTAPQPLSCWKLHQRFESRELKNNTVLEINPTLNGQYYDQYQYSQSRPVCSGGIQKEPFPLPVTCSLKRERNQIRRTSQNERMHLSYLWSLWSWVKFTCILLFTIHHGYIHKAAEHGWKCHSHCWCTDHFRVKLKYGCWHQTLTGVNVATVFTQLYKQQCLTKAPVMTLKEERITDGLDGVGTSVPGHDRHVRAQVIGRRLQTHPVHCSRTDPQHLCDTARELRPNQKRGFISYLVTTFICHMSILINIYL